MTLRTLNYGNYGIFLIMGHAGFCPSTVGTLRGVRGRGVGDYTSLNRPYWVLFVDIKEAQKRNGLPC